jgi:2-polyprenyl-3-methyl-5-hydroxy-6-metoxy-1,4-benzoquinol methylase
VNDSHVSVSIDDFDEAAESFDEDFRIERARAVAKHIDDIVGLRPDQSVLDFGCGTGLLGFSLLPHIGRLTLLDTSSGMLDQAKRKITAADAHRVRTLLFDPESETVEGSYDLIATLMTLHHIPDAEATVEMLAVHVAPGGTLALADLETEDGSFHGPQAEVHRGFDRSVIRDWMTANGLQDLRESTPWIMQREVTGEPREYPVFLIAGRR